MASSPAVPVVTDFSGTAGQNIDNAKAGALASIAASGQTGQANLAQAAQMNAASKTAALQNAMAYAALRGAPQGNVTAGQQGIAQPFDQRASLLGLMQQNYGQNNQAMQQANTNFFDQAKAALPIANAALQTSIKNDQEKAAERQMVLNSGLQRDALANQVAMAKLNNSSGSDGLTGTQGRLATLSNGLTGPNFTSSLNDAVSGLEHGFSANSIIQAIESRGFNASDAALMEKQAEGQMPKVAKAPAQSGGRLEVLATGLDAPVFNDAYGQVSQLIANGMKDAAGKPISAAQAISAIQSYGFNPADAALIYNSALSSAQKTSTFTASQP